MKRVLTRHRLVRNLEASSLVLDAGTGREQNRHRVAAMENVGLRWLKTNFRPRTRNVQRGINCSNLDEYTLSGLSIPQYFATIGDAVLGPSKILTDSYGQGNFNTPLRSNSSQLMDTLCKVSLFEVFEIQGLEGKEKPNFSLTKLVPCEHAVPCLYPVNVSSICIPNCRDRTRNKEFWGFLCGRRKKSKVRLRPSDTQFSYLQTCDACVLTARPKDSACFLLLNSVRRTTNLFTHFDVGTVQWPVRHLHFRLVDGAVSGEEPGAGVDAAGGEYESDDVNTRRDGATLCESEQRLCWHLTETCVVNGTRHAAADSCCCWSRSRPSRCR